MDVPELELRVLMLKHILDNRKLRRLWSENPKQANQAFEALQRRGGPELFNTLPRPHLEFLLRTMESVTQATESIYLTSTVDYIAAHAKGTPFSNAERAIVSIGGRFTPIIEELRSKYPNAATNCVKEIVKQRERYGASG